MQMDEATTQKLEEYQQRVTRDRKHFDKIVAWHLQAFSSAGIDLPYNVDATYVSVDFNNPVWPDWKKPSEVNEDGTPNPRGWVYCWDKVRDEEKIIKHLSKVAKFARSMGYKVEKNYDHDFSINVTLPGVENSDTDKDVTIRYYTDREAVCVKKVVGTKVVPAQTTPERIEEVIEWDCQKIAFTA
jgi:hypothetical protein